METHKTLVSKHRRKTFMTYSQAELAMILKIRSIEEKLKIGFQQKYKPLLRAGHC